jgi:tetratricopeptide (TPR) repeat protein
MGSIADEAQALHQQGREAGGAGDTQRALALFARAYELAPDWAYPPYDMAFTYVLNGRLDEAEKWYTVVDTIEPRGFFTAKTSLDIIRREQRGELFAGFAKAYAMLEWAPEHQQRQAFAQIAARYPTFAPAWKQLAQLAADDHERLAALDRGLAGDPDDETYGMLVLNKALVLSRRGEGTEGARLLQALLADPRCTRTVESLATTTLAGLG